jgi:hypothetical protein
MESCRAVSTMSHSFHLKVGHARTGVASAPAAYLIESDAHQPGLELGLSAEIGGVKMIAHQPQNEAVQSELMSLKQIGEFLLIAHMIPVYGLYTKTLVHPHCHPITA